VTAFLAYAGIFVSAAVEGEIVYTAAAVLVHLGYLNPLGVFLAGALGGSAGDQFFFYVLRTRLSLWLDRFPTIARRRNTIVERVQWRAVWIILASRFLPGLRIAIPAACAYAGVAPLKFSALSLISGAAWAAAIMGVVAFLGPASLSELGLRAWWTPIIPALLVACFFRWLGGGIRSEQL
jgi:membrane protein DedA with SNARE-associated domain